MLLDRRSQAVRRCLFGHRHRITGSLLGGSGAVLSVPAKTVPWSLFAVIRKVDCSRCGSIFYQGPPNG